MKFIPPNRFASRRRGITSGWSILALVLTFAGAYKADGQDGTWTAHTSMREVTALALSPEAIWVGTTGGLFRYSPESGEISRYTIAEGLHGITVLSAAYDPGNDSRGPAVWIGYRDGVLDQLSADGSIRTFRDIERASRFPIREINRLKVRGDSLLASTSFGLVVFDLNLYEVRDSYTQFGSLNPGVPVRDVIIAPGPDGTDHHLWVATEEGIAQAPLATPNLKDPASWTIEDQGLLSNSAHAVAYFGGRLYVGTDRGVAYRTPAGTYVDEGLTGGRVNGLYVTPNRLLGVDQGALLIVEADGSGRRYELEGVAQPNVVMADQASRVWIGDAADGLARLAPLAQSSEPDVEDVFFPQGPYHNQFGALQTDASGHIWAGGLLAIGSGNGFYRLSPEGEWTNFIGRDYDELRGRDSFTIIHVDAGGSLWAGSQHAGLAQVTPDGSVRIFDHTNSSIPIADGTSSTIFLGGIGNDPRGRLWVTSRYASRPLSVRTSDDQWVNLPFRDCGGVTSTSGTYDRLYIDSYGQKWIDIKNRANLRQGIGLMILDTGNTADDPSDDACRFFGEPGAQGQGMPGLLVTSMVEDRAGLMWIGTDRGLAYFLNNGVLAHDRTATPIWPQYEDRSQGVFIFQGLGVNGLAVDPANQLWVATNEGAWLIRQSGGGFAVEAHFTTANSPLLSNVVVAVTVEPRMGRVYFATDRGLVSFAGDAIASAPEARDLFVYPNPARVGIQEDASILIEGLVDETEVMILTPHGAVVRRFMARGGRARWDGRDESGRPAPSGMYLVVALGQSGEGTAYGKLALIR